jgi:T-complex protein 1 subunit delta
VITNDGATILNKMSVTQPAAKMLVQLAASQDAAAGDGTTTVTVVAGALLAQCGKLLARGMHPTSVADGFAAAASFAARSASAKPFSQSPFWRPSRRSLKRSSS